MDQKRFFKTLLSIKINGKPIFVRKRIKDIPQSPCKNSETIVCDFDHAKRIIVKKYNLISLSSCDAIKLLENVPRIDFIEFKSIKDILLSDTKGFRSVDDFMRKISNLNLHQKIIDSYHLLYNIITDNAYDFKGNDRKVYNALKKLYIIVFDFDQITPLQRIQFSLNYLGSYYSIERMVKEAVSEKIKPADLLNISAPIIKDCQTIDPFYT